MDLKLVTSAANPLVKKIRSLDLKKNRDDLKLFMVEGERHITDALAGGFIPDTIVMDEKASYKKIADAALGHKAEAVRMPYELLQRITGRDNAEDVIAVFRQRGGNIGDMKIHSKLWVGLEGIRDPGNLGTIIRTAHAAGADGIILCGPCCDPWSPECIRATMGSFAHIDIVSTSVDDFTAWKKKTGMLTIGTHLEGAVDYRAATYKSPMILMMGSESKGMSADMTATCDTLVKIPMPGGTESLNLAVATGILLYEVQRGRI